MKKIFLIAIAAVLLPAALRAQPRNYFATLSVGSKLPNDESERGQIVEGTMYGETTDIYAVGLSMGHCEFANKEKAMAKGTVTMTPVIAKLRLFNPPDKHVSVFMEGGPVYYFLNHRLDQDLENALAQQGQKYREEMRDTLGLYLGAGINLHVANSVTVGVSAAQYFLASKVEHILTVNNARHVSSNRIQFDFTSLNGTVAYHF